MKWAYALTLVAFGTAGLATACGDANSSEPTFYVAGIPDQNAATLARRHDALTSYLSRELGVDVRYRPTVSYAATVAAFKRGDVHMAWFGGLTGVQARGIVPGSLAIAQRPRDAAFRSKFIVRADLEVNNLQQLRGRTFTFGSESSTSGHLMPRHFLLQASIDPDTDFKGNPNYSGSHDKTWKLVESGAFQAGALSEAVWEAAIEDGKVDTTTVRELFTTPPYYDYNWSIRGDLDTRFGAGFSERAQQALLNIGQPDQEILDLYSADGFVETRNENYEAIREVAESLGIIRQ
jgi:phosphonate transport system substrate-binding protein